MGERCSKHLMQGYHRVQCKRASSCVGTDGKPYCAQHNPAAVEQRRRERSAKWAAKWAAQEQQREAARRENDAQRELVEAVLRHHGRLPAWLEPFAAAVRNARKVSHE